jgi:hypothetical protein
MNKNLLNFYIDTKKKKAKKKAFEDIKRFVYAEKKFNAGKIATNKTVGILGGDYNRTQTKQLERLIAM